MFESSVNLDGTKTKAVRMLTAALFESSVNSDGTKTNSERTRRRTMFESSGLYSVSDEYLSDALSVTAVKKCRRRRFLRRCRHFYYCKKGLFSNTYSAALHKNCQNHLKSVERAGIIYRNIRGIAPHIGRMGQTDAKSRTS